MEQKKSSWVNADELIGRSHPDQVMSHYGVPIPQKQSGGNYRLECPLPDCNSQKSSYGQLAIELEPPFRIHCFTCGVRGNLFDLMWIMKHESRPDGGKLRGNAFKEILGDLQLILGQEPTDKPSLPAMASTPLSQNAPPKEKPATNTPLIKSENERTRELVHLWEDGTTDRATMNPAAAQYFAQRPFLTPELCAKWGLSYLPANAKGTLRGRIVYRVDSVAGEALAYAGRDANYIANHAAWLRKKKGIKPVKTRFPSGKFFQKGLELYGQQAHRLSEPSYRETISQTGVLVTEGFNDVLALDSMGQPAVGLMSNQVTDQQLQKLVRFAHNVGGHKITLMLDRNASGQSSQQSAMAKLAKYIPVLDGWGGYEGEATEPEHFSLEEWTIQKQVITDRWRLLGLMYQPEKNQ